MALVQSRRQPSPTNHAAARRERQWNLQKHIGHQRIARNVRTDDMQRNCLHHWSVGSQRVCPLPDRISTPRVKHCPLIKLQLQGTDSLTTCPPQISIIMHILISDLFQSESVQRAVASSVQQVRLRVILPEHQDRGVKLPNAFSLATTAVVACPVNPCRRLSSLCSCDNIVQVSEPVVIYCNGPIHKGIRVEGEGG